MKSRTEFAVVVIVGWAILVGYGLIPAIPRQPLREQLPLPTLAD